MEFVISCCFLQIIIVFKNTAVHTVDILLHIPHCPILEVNALNDKVPRSHGSFSVPHSSERRLSHVWNTYEERRVGTVLLLEGWTEKNGMCSLGANAVRKSPVALSFSSYRTCTPHPLPIPRLHTHAHTSGLPLRSTEVWVACLRTSLSTGPVWALPIVGFCLQEHRLLAATVPFQYGRSNNVRASLFWGQWFKIEYKNHRCK